MKTQVRVSGSALFLATILGVTVPCFLAYLFHFRPPPPTLYKASSVRQVCHIFDIPYTEDFCIHADKQWWHTLQTTLNQRFPKGQATFSQVMNNLEVSYIDFSEDPKKFGTWDAIAATFTGFAVANCPDISDTAHFYTCSIYFKEDIWPIRVDFEYGTDVVSLIGVGRTGS